MKYFSELNDIVFAVSTRHDGNLDFRFGENEMVLKNREKFLKKFGLKIKDGVATSLVHKDEIKFVDQKLFGSGMGSIDSAIEVDALFTNDKNVYLFMLTADCIPLSLYDPVKKVVGLVHLGWKGVDLKLAEKAIKEMVGHYGSDPKDILANIGPAIRKESYKFVDPVQKNMPEWQSYLSDIEDDQTSIDIIQYTKDQLVKAGLNKGNIFDKEINTFEDDSYFSHLRSVRNKENKGRFATIIGLK